MVIGSSSNAKIKRLRSLYTKKGRETEKVFLAEGVNIVKDIPADSGVVCIYAKESEAATAKIIADRHSVECVVIKDDLFDRLTDQVTPSGLVAEIRIPVYPRIEYRKVMVMDGVSDAGNAGTIIRTAAACGFDAVYALGGVDLYSPKCVRSTMGGIFRIPCIKSNVDDFDFNGKIYLLDMNGQDIFQEAPSLPYAVVVGSEAHGASAEMKLRASKVLSIPMKNDTESLNAAVSASLAMYILENHRR